MTPEDWVKPMLRNGDSFQQTSEGGRIVLWIKRAPKWWQRGILRPRWRRVPWWDEQTRWDRFGS